MQLQLNTILVNTGDKLVLIDTGCGVDKFQKTAGRLIGHLAAAGYAPSDIDMILLTHAHFDHLWGISDGDNASLLFPSAEFVASEAEVAFWSNPELADKLPPAQQPRVTQTKLKLASPRLHLIKPGAEVAPGVTTFDTVGHTPGHMSVHISSGSEEMLLTGDVVFNSAVSFLHPEWPFVGFDLDVPLATKVRIAFLDFLYRRHQPVMSRVGVDQDHQIICKPCILDVGVLAETRGLFRPLQHTVNLGEVEIAEQWRDHPALRNAMLTVGFEHDLQQAHHVCIIHPSCHLGQQTIMSNVVKIAAQVDVYDACLVLNNRSGYPVDRFMSCPLGTISKRSRLEVCLEDRLQYELERTLHHSISDRRNRKDADLAPVLWYLLPPGRERHIGVLNKFVSYPFQDLDGGF